jgi:hypothetical protein
MSRTESAYKRLAAANPIPDPERYMATVFDMDAAPNDFKEVIVSTKTDEKHQIEGTDSGPLRGGRWRVATVVFIAVLALGGGLLVATLVSDGSDSAGDTPIGVVEAFFERWNAGDVDGAMTLVSPDATAFGLPAVVPLRGLVEFTSPFDGRMEVDCSTGASPGRVTCDWAWATVATRALGLTGATDRTFDVEEGLITQMLPPNYNALDAPMRDFAMTEDPAGFAKECSPDGSPVNTVGTPHNQRCGTFLAGLEAAFVASLGG